MSEIRPGRGRVFINEKKEKCHSKDKNFLKVKNFGNPSFCF
jgi:hypothetical protein